MNRYTHLHKKAIQFWTQVITRCCFFSRDQFYIIISPFLIGIFDFIVVVNWIREIIIKALWNFHLENQNRCIWITSRGSVYIYHWIRRKEKKRKRRKRIEWPRRKDTKMFAFDRDSSIWHCHQKKGCTVSIKMCDSHKKAHLNVTVPSMLWKH